MAGGSAFSVLATHIGQAAHINTVVVDTSPAGSTIRVSHTFQLNTPHIGIAFGSGRT